MSVKYDSVVVFDRGITIDDGPVKEGGNGVCTIYGLLYNREQRHKISPVRWLESTLMTITYLMGCERLQNNGGDMSKTEWFLPNGRVVPLTYQVRYFIHSTLLPEIIGHRIVEFPKQFELGFRQSDGMFLLSREPLERLGLVDIVEVDIPN